MRKTATNKTRLQGLKSFLGTMDDFGKAMLFASLSITVIELWAVLISIILEYRSGVLPIDILYIPVLKQILSFAVISVFLSFAFDLAARKENTNA